MDQGSKRLYIRYLSNVVRKWSPSSSVNNMTENPVFPVDGVNRAVIVTICRIRQRILTQAWSVWVKNTAVTHDYEADARMILYRHIPVSELRTELEIEVLYKWVIQVKDLDPTGIANTIFLCKRKAVVYAALQQLRLEFYEPGETVLFEGDIPRAEDGHFTVFKGECEVLQFPDESVPLMKLLYLAKKKRWEEAKLLLTTAPIVAKIPKLSGFGELSTLTGVKRAASIRVSPKMAEPAEVLILPKEALLDCLKSRTSEDVEGASTSEAIDFLRQSGLANRISPKDLVSAASSMIRRTLVQGEILYYKGETAKSIFLVVSGEFLLDTGDFMVNGQPAPFVRATDDRCYHLTSGSILGEEGVVGDGNVYISTAAVVSSAAVVFEAVSFGMNFLAEKVGGLRYSALYYRDKLCWDFAQPIAEQNNPYTFFNSLRKSISHIKPYRGLESLAAAACAEHRIQEQAQKLHNAKQAELRKQKMKNIRGGLFPAATLMTMQNAEKEKKPEDDNPFLSYPRTLTGVGLHRAVDINKHAKKLLQTISRSHAKETILFEQLNRIPEEEKYDEEMVHAEQLFEQSLKEYYERCAAQARKMKEEEENRRRNAVTRASSAIKFFSASSTGGLGDDDGDHKDTATHDGSSEGQPDNPLEAAREEAVRIADQRPFSANLRRHRDSVIHDMNMAKLYSMDIAMDPALLHANKLEMYFQWVDSLTLMAHKNLLQQAEQTAEELHDLLYHDHTTHYLLGKNLDQAMNANSVSEEERWAELGKIFQQYGLTPMDITLQWMGSTNENEVVPSAKLHPPAAKKGSDAHATTGATGKDDSLPPVNESSHDGNTLKKTVDETKKSFKSQRSNTAKSFKSVKSETSKARSTTSKVSNNTTSTNNAAGGGGGGGTSSSPMKKVTSYAAKEHEEKMIKAHLDSKYKSYTPSSWRDDMIQKKSQETTVTHVFHFLRASTPDNRRTVFLYVVPPSRDPNAPNQTHHPHHPAALPSAATAQPAHPGAKLTIVTGASPRDGAAEGGKDTPSDAPSLVDYSQFIAEPDYFMTALRENPLSHIQRTKRDLDAWDTRFLNVRNTKRNSSGAELNKADEEAAALKIVEKVTLPQIVRTHLKEDLQHYSRNAVLAAAHEQLQNSETHFMRIIFGKELDSYQPPKSLRNSWNASRNTSFLDDDGPDGGRRRRRRKNPIRAAMDAAVEAVGGEQESSSTLLSSSTPTLRTLLTPPPTYHGVPPIPTMPHTPGSPAHTHDGKHSPSAVSVATSEKEYEADILRSLPTLGDAHFSSTLRAPSADPHHLMNEPSIMTMPSVAEGDAESAVSQREYAPPAVGQTKTEDSFDVGSTAGSSIAEDSDRDDASSIAGDDANAMSRRPSQVSQQANADGAATSTTAAAMGAVTGAEGHADGFGLAHGHSDHHAPMMGLPPLQPPSTDSTVVHGGAIESSAHHHQHPGDSAGIGILPTVSQDAGNASPTSVGRRGRNKAAAQKVYIRYTDTKPASSALQEFESFMKSQDPQFTKAKAEGRKRANQKCKYRLAPSLRGDPELLAAVIAQQQKAARTAAILGTEVASLTSNSQASPTEDVLQNTTLGTDIHLRPKVSLKRIIMERLKAEIAVFQAMYPKATMVQRRSFIESFQSKYPESEINVHDYEEAAQALAGGAGGGYRSTAAAYSPGGSQRPTATGPAVFEFEKRPVDVNDHIPIPMMTLAKKMMNATSATATSPLAASGSRAGSPTALAANSGTKKARSASIAGGSPPRSPSNHLRSKLIERGGGTTIASNGPSREISRPGTATTIASTASSPPPRSPKPKRGSLLRSSSTFMLDVAESAVTFVNENNEIDVDAAVAAAAQRVTTILTIGDDAQGDSLETRSHVSHMSHESNATSSLASPAQRKMDAAKTRRRHSMLMDATQAMLQMKEDELLDTYDVEIDHDNAHIEDWQRYTIQCIVKEKSGERKILPSIATKKTMESLALSGKRYRGESGGGYSLITLASKQSEEPIAGPTSYLELYKNSFHIPTSRRMKEKIQKELKEAAKSMHA